MSFNKLTLLSIGLLSSLSFTVKAQVVQPHEQTHVVIAPTCLVKKSHLTYKTLASTTSFSLIEVNDAGIHQLVKTKNQGARADCGGFMDITQKWDDFNAKKQSTVEQAHSFLLQHLSPPKSMISKTHYAIKYQTQVNHLLKQINPQDMWTDLTTLSNFPNRYADSENGIKAAEWIRTQIETMIKNNNRDDVTIELVATGSSYKQPSVVVKIGKNLSEPGVVVGGHMDTLEGTKPGADDDGTGTVTVLEVARTILSSGMHFKKPLYLIWYAAEEEGLVGSGYVVTKFKKEHVPVNAVMQLDMTGYAYKNDPTIWLMTDFVNEDLTTYLRQLINQYVKQPVKTSRCGYACSDHASWHHAGYAAAIPFESNMSTYNPSIHTSRDTMEKLSLTHMTDYAKLAIAFAIELAEPVV